MPKPKALACFTPEERARAHALLAIRVAHMNGRKFEEGDWSYVYCRAKNIPETHWSNLNIDVMHGNLGVEHKMLCARSNASLEQACGTSFMHPAATRSIRVPSLDTPANEAMRNILTQYAELIQQRREKVRQQNTTGKPLDMRTGWLLWQESLRQFLYFEEPMVEPDPDIFYAEWNERGAGASARKGSKNLWIFETATGKKRYSVTTSAGAKIQPYFDIPPPNDPNLYIFTVIGEHIETGKIRVWLTPGTAKELRRIVGSLDTDVVSDAVIRAVQKIEIKEREQIYAVEESGEMVTLREDAYRTLVEAMPGINDDHCIRLVLEQMLKT